MSEKPFLAVALVGAMWVSAAVADNAQAERGMNVGEVLPSRTLKTIDRATEPFPAPGGLTVLLFWSTWSPRSEPALALWKRYQDEYRDKGVKVITLNADHQTMTEENRREVAAFIEGKQVALPVIQDDGLELYNEIGVMVLPTVYFIKTDGVISFKYPGFPSSAELDLKEDLEKALGIWVEPKSKASEAALAYQPKNNAMLYYNLGLQLHQKGQFNVAEGKYLEALKRDPDYPEPLRALEGIYFRPERNALTEGALKDLLKKNGLEGIIDRIGQGTPLAVQIEKKTDLQLRMKQLMEKGAGGAQ